MSLPEQAKSKPPFLTRRDFVWKGGFLGAGLAAGATKLPDLTSQPGNIDFKLPAAPDPWSIRLSPDGHFCEITYRGEKWLSRLQVNLKARGKLYSSSAASAQLNQVSSSIAETVFQIQGPLRFQLVFNRRESRLLVSLRNVQAPKVECAEVEAVVDGGSEPIQGRLEVYRLRGHVKECSEVQQMVSGVAASSLNDCVFDRFRDQALRVKSRYTRFTPNGIGFKVVGSTDGTAAPVCCFEVLERVYKNRLPYYAPLDKEQWSRPPIGWCSFHYYRNAISEDDILRNAEALARDYGAFGLEYVLIDGGWQARGVSGNWKEANSHFPHGMKWLAEKLRAFGQKPALWLSVFGTDDEGFYKAHRNWFLHDATGDPRLGEWYGTYIGDFSNPALKQYLYGIYREMTMDWGYDYFKLDGENAARDIWAANRVRAYNPALDADTAFREALSLIREAMNSRPGVFLSACGPEYPTESAGIVQSARLGNDVAPSFRGLRLALEGMRRGYYTHNIVWYGDPDCVLLRPPLTLDEAQTWASIVGLTGQLLLLGDDMPALPPERREIARKIMPVVDIKPMDLFSQPDTPRIWVLHIGRQFGYWAVIGLFNWDYDDKEVPFTVGGAPTPFESVYNHDASLLGPNQRGRDFAAIVGNVQNALAENRRLQALPNKPAGLELLPIPVYLSPPAPRRIVLNFEMAGLLPDREYLLFDFWKQKFLGKMQGAYSVALPPHACQVLSARPASSHPQLIGTDRHITVGGAELLDERWDSATARLSLQVLLVENYPTTLTIYKAGSYFLKAGADHATTLQALDNVDTLQIRLVRSSAGAADVVIHFEGGA